MQAGNHERVERFLIIKKNNNNKKRKYIHQKIADENSLTESFEINLFDSISLR